MQTLDENKHSSLIIKDGLFQPGTVALQHKILVMWHWFCTCKSAQRLREHQLKHLFRKRTRQLAYPTGTLSNCDDSGEQCQVQYDSCWCPESRPGYLELMSLVHYRVECLSGFEHLQVWVPLSALTYFRQLFTNHTVQCGHMSVLFY